MFEESDTRRIVEVQRMKFSIEWENVGRGKYTNKITKDFKSLSEAEIFAYKCADDHLVSNQTSLEVQSSKMGIYNVFSGFRAVGVVKINEVKDEKLF